MGVMTEVIWKDVPNYNGVQASNMGQIRRINSDGSTNGPISTWMGRGYCRVSVPIRFVVTCTTTEDLRRLVSRSNLDVAIEKL